MQFSAESEASISMLKADDIEDTDLGVPVKLLPISLWGHPKYNGRSHNSMYISA